MPMHMYLHRIMHLRRFRAREDKPRTHVHVRDGHDILIAILISHQRGTTVRRRQESRVCQKLTYELLRLLRD